MFDSLKRPKKEAKIVPKLEGLGFLEFWA